MGFSERDREQLLKLRGVTKFVIARLEECGYSSISEFARVDGRTVLDQLAQTMDGSLWKFTSQARIVDQILKLTHTKSQQRRFF